jgi:hypothetical protein
MGYRASVLRNRIIIILVTIVGVTGCSWLIGIGNLFKVVLFLITALTCLIGGALFVIFRFGQKERLAFIILAAWYGFTFALLTLLGMLLDPRSVNFSWIYSFQVAGLVGIGTFVFILLLTPINMALLRVWRRSFGNPVIRTK